MSRAMFTRSMIRAGVCMSTLAVSAVALLALPACSSNPREGYSFSSTYRTDISSVSVPVFDNQTFSYGLEAGLTEAIVSEIRRSTPWKVTDAEAAQTSLKGTITSVDMSRLSTARDTGLVEQLAVTITVEFTWKDNRTGRTLVARQNFQGSGTFVPAGGYRERLAVGEDDATQRLARDLVAELRSAW